MILKDSFIRDKVCKKNAQNNYTLWITTVFFTVDYEVFGGGTHPDHAGGIGGVHRKIFLGPTGLSLQMQMYLQLSLLSSQSNNQKLSLCASCAGLILIQNC